MARTLKPTPYHIEAEAARAKAEAAAAKAKADAAAAKAKAGAEPPAAKTGRQDRSPSLRRSKRTGTAKETTGGKAPRQQRAEEKQVPAPALSMAVLLVFAPVCCGGAAQRAGGRE